MKINLVITLFFLLFMVACKPKSVTTTSDNDTSSAQVWIAKMITEFDKETYRGQQIVALTYHGKKIFLVEDCFQCPDALSYAYDEDKNVVCQFGGITGKNTCPDIDLKRGYKLIYKKAKPVE